MYNKEQSTSNRIDVWQKEVKNLAVKKSGGTKTAVINRKAFHDYFIEDKWEAGIQLYGTEVKSIRNGSVNLKDSYCYIDKGEIFATGIYISPYEKGNIYNRDPLRIKKLLLHKKEIMKLIGLVGQQGYTLIPLRLYFSKAMVKVEIGLCKGKKLYDKREADARRQAERDMERFRKDQSSRE